VRRSGRAGIAIVVLAILAVAPLREARAGTGSRLARWLARPLLRVLVHSCRRPAVAVDAAGGAPFVASPRKPPW
jgi:hypothetical protein